MKKLRVLLLALVSLATPVVAATPASAAEPCLDAQVCFYSGSNFEGSKTFYWDGTLRVGQKYGAPGFVRNARSIRNRTPYYFHIWSDSGDHRCLPPGYRFTYVGDRYVNRIKYFGQYSNWC